MHCDGQEFCMQYVFIGPNYAADAPPTAILVWPMAWCHNDHVRERLSPAPRRQRVRAAIIHAPYLRSGLCPSYWEVRIGVSFWGSIFSLLHLSQVMPKGVQALPCFQRSWASLCVPCTWPSSLVCLFAIVLSSLLGGNRSLPWSSHVRFHCLMFTQLTPSSVAKITSVSLLGSYSTSWLSPPSSASPSCHPQSSRHSTA